MAVMVVVRVSLNGYKVSTTAVTLLPPARTTEVLNGPRYKCTSDLESGVVRNAFEMNLGQPCGWLTVQQG